MSKLIRVSSVIIIMLFLSLVVFADNSDDVCLTPGLRVISYNKTIRTTREISLEELTDKAGCAAGEIKVITLPSPEDGTLTVSGVPVSINDVITVTGDTVLRYSSNNGKTVAYDFETDCGYVFCCTVNAGNDDNNNPPEGSLTKKKIYTVTDKSVNVNLPGYDSDGDGLYFEIEAYPKNGVLDGSGKTCVYTPFDGYVGSDSFKYRVFDESGSVSDIIEVSISVKNEILTLEDTSLSSHAYAAEQVVKDGIMKVSGNRFEPEKEISKIDFLVSFMKTVGVNEVIPCFDTVFDDDTELSDEERGYLSLAFGKNTIKGEVENGKFVWKPSETITASEAADIINTVMGLYCDDTVYTSAEGYKPDNFSILEKYCIIDEFETPRDVSLSRECAAEILFQIYELVA